jgi:3-deoxy-D-manno-octulosonic-acid transferase
LLTALLQPLMVARLWWRGRAEPLYRHAIAQRWGWGYAKSLRSDLGPPIWIHAVSLGETRAAAALVQALRRVRPNLRLVLTHGTATGREAGRALMRPGDAQTWLPIELPGAVGRFFSHHQPALGVLMETEIWPLLLRRAAPRGVPMVLANARLSARSEQKGNRLAALWRPAVASIELCLAQTEADAQRLRASGARKVLCSGNLKFDIAPDASLVAAGFAWRQRLGRKVVLGAVTREGEEEDLLREWKQLPTPRPLLVMVPRHPQRFDAVEALIRAAGLSVVRRSSWTGGEPAEAALDAEVWLGDSMGEMPLYYGLAQVALLGGSFAPLGGQNLIEAAACGCPIVMGPHTFNFEQASELALAAGGAQRVANMAEGVAAAWRWLAAPEEVGAAASNALRFASQHRGAADRMAAEILALLSR